MSKHTPGPWFKRGSKIVGPGFGRERVVADVKVIDEEGQENGTLISATPDLLEVALQVMAWWEEHQYDTCGGHGEYNTYEDEPEFVKSARSAIAKARGEA